MVGFLFRCRWPKSSTPSKRNKTRGLCVGLIGLVGWMVGVDVLVVFTNAAALSTPVVASLFLLLLLLLLLMDSNRSKWLLHMAYPG